MQPKLLPYWIRSSIVMTSPPPSPPNGRRQVMYVGRRERCLPSPSLTWTAATRPSSPHRPFYLLLRYCLLRILQQRSELWRTTFPCSFISHHFSSFLIVSHRFSSFLIVSRHFSSFLIVFHRFSPFLIVFHHFSSFLIVSHRFS